MFRSTGRVLQKPLSSLTGGYLKSSLARNVDVSPEVLDALSRAAPVVALESTVISHGFPYPENLSLALSLENIVRSTGAIPATIGIVAGRIKIGLTKAELERLANPIKPGSVVKISRRDIAPACAMKADGGTTCASTLIFSALAGIKVFATGGLGGVHRGGELSMDVSADLHELTRCPVGLVASGVKSILDIGRTLEYLETLGVPVIAYAKSREFPAFFSPRSGFEVPWNTDSPSIAADILYTQSQLGMQNGVLFAAPIPEKYAAAGMEIQQAVEQAVAESEANGVSKRGKEATPWLLNRVKELSNGTSLTSNIALIENTALIGGQIAVEYQKLAQLEKPRSNDPVIPSLSSTPISLPDSPSEPKSQIAEKTKVIVLGAAAVDVSARAFNADSNSALSSTVPGSISVSLGGVGRNVAEASHRVAPEDGSVLLLSSIGDDSFGKMLVRETETSGMRTDGLLCQKGQRTAVCNLIMNSKGDLTTGIADMAIAETLSANEALEVIERHEPSIIALDGNSSPDLISAVAKWSQKRGVKVLFEPTSVVKSTRILKAFETIPTAPISSIDFISPNLIELGELFATASEGPTDLMSHPNYWTALDSLSLASKYRMDLEHLSRANVSLDSSTKGTLSFLLDQGTAQMAVTLLPFFQHIIVKCGEKGVLVVMRISAHNSASKWHQEQSNINARYIVSHSDSGETVVVSHFPALPVDNLTNVTGAGDSFVGTLLTCLAQRPDAFDSPKSLRQVIDLSQRAAVLALGSHEAVSPRLSELKKDVASL